MVISNRFMVKGDYFIKDQKTFLMVLNLSLLPPMIKVWVADAPIKVPINAPGIRPTIPPATTEKLFGKIKNSPGRAPRM